MYRSHKCIPRNKFCSLPFSLFKGKNFLVLLSYFALNTWTFYRNLTKFKVVIFGFILHRKRFVKLAPGESIQQHSFNKQLLIIFCIADKVVSLRDTEHKC